MLKAYLETIATTAEQQNCERPQNVFFLRSLPKKQEDALTVIKK